MRRGWLRILIIFVLVVALILWGLHRAVQQERRNWAIIDAIRIADTKRVLSLLEQGADPNAHEKSEGNTQTNLSLWQRILALFRPSTQKKSPDTSALWIAIREDLEENKQLDTYSTQAISPNSAYFETIIGALLRAGAKPQADEAKAVPALRWAERYQHRMLQEIPKVPSELWPGFEFDGVKASIQDIITKYGPSAAAYTLMARCCLQADHYAEAAHYARLALLFRPNQADAQALLIKSEHLEQIAKGVSELLPADSNILHLRPFPVRPNLWVAVSARRDGEAKDYLNVRLTLCQKQNERFVKLWRSENLSHSNEPIEADLFVTDLTGDGIPEVVLHQIFPGGSVEPSQMDVFAWRNGTLKSILRAEGTDPLWLEDPECNHHYVVRNSYEIGSDMSHADQPRWSDLYAYRNGRFVIANADYPNRFTEMRKELLDTLKHHPGDYECRKYLAYVESIQGDKATARQNYIQTAQDFTWQHATTLKSRTGGAIRRALRDLQNAQRTLPKIPLPREPE